MPGAVAALDELGVPLGRPPDLAASATSTATRARGGAVPARRRARRAPHGPARGAARRRPRRRRRPVPDRPVRRSPTRGDHLLVDGEPTRYLRRGRRAALPGAPDASGSTGRPCAAAPLRAARATSPCAPWTAFVEVHWSPVGRGVRDAGRRRTRSASRCSADRAATASTTCCRRSRALRRRGCAVRRALQVRGAGPLRQRCDGRVRRTGAARGRRRRLRRRAHRRGHRARARPRPAPPWTAIAADDPARYERDLPTARPAPRPAHPRPARGHQRAASCAGTDRARPPALPRVFDAAVDQLAQAGMSRSRGARPRAEMRRPARRGRARRRHRPQGDGAPPRDPAAPGVLLLPASTPTAGCC